MTKKALEAMDAKKLTPVVLLDLSKTFDSLDHHRLIAKFTTLGVGRTALELKLFVRKTAIRQD